MQILAARKYPTPRNGLLSMEDLVPRSGLKNWGIHLEADLGSQTETRRLAYAIKDLASPLADFDTAARDMAALITGPCWLVPIPDSNGNTDANARLAHHIARYVNGAQIAKAIHRTQSVQSQCARHKHALGPISPEQHHFARTRKALTLRQTYFVDNVTTSGNTLEAARLALGFGAGLVFADAAPRRVQLQATLL